MEKGLPLLGSVSGDSSPSHPNTGPTMASHPSEPVLLSAPNLKSLITSDGKNRVKDFITSQARYAKARVNEGRAVRASWDISTPEKEKKRLHRDKPSAGFETPVLKPRAAQAQVKPRARPTSPPRQKASQSPKRDKKVKAKSAFVEAVSPKRQKKQNDKSAQSERQLRPPKTSRKRCHPRSDTDEEHLARLTDRRERRREKREIMDPREVTKASTTSRKERKDDATSGPASKKKQKISADFALMHGFSSANLGKNRLTVEPPLNFGVFNKGKASEKVKVDERKRSKNKGFPSRIFSEDRFLSSRPAKQPAERASGSEHSEPMSIECTSHESSLLIKPKRSSAVQLRKTPIKIKGTMRRQQQSIHTQCDIEEMSRGVRSKTGAEFTPLAKSGTSRSSVQSATWAIERDDCSLPSTSSEIVIGSVKSKTETAFLDVRTTAWGRVLKDNLRDTTRLSPPTTNKGPPTAPILPTVTREVPSKVLPETDVPATIGPWESASQVARSVLHPQDPRSTYSKFFPLPHVDKSGSGEHMAHIAPPERSKEIGSAHSDSDPNPIINEPLVRRSASLDWRGEGQLPRATILSALANASSVNDTPMFPEERTSALQTSSLDSIDRALLIPHAPKAANFPYRLSQPRRPVSQPQEFNLTPDDMELYQYDLELIDGNYEVPLPLLRPTSSDEIEGRSSPLRHSDALGTVRNTQHRSLCFQGYEIGEFDTYGEGELQCYEDYPSTVFNSPELANDMVYIVPSSPYEHQNEAVFFTNEDDTNYEMVMEPTSEPSTDFIAQPEHDEDTRTNIRLWDHDAVLPRGELTNVQRVEQDVAKKLKGHWFPHKF